MGRAPEGAIPQALSPQVNRSQFETSQSDPYNGRAYGGHVMRALGVGLCWTLLASAPVAARTWHVAPDGSGDVPTIRAALDSSVAGDDVLLACGTYEESDLHLVSGVLLHGSSTDCTLLRGAAGQTTLVCEDAHDVAVRDLRIAGGDSRLRILRSAPVELTRCEFVGDGADPVAGRALGCDFSTLILSACTFSGNPTWGDPAGEGAALRGVASDVRAMGCVFQSNTTLGRFGARGGAVALKSCTAELAQCTFLGNRADQGGGLYAAATTLILADCTFTENVAPGGLGGFLGVGAGVYFVQSTAAVVTGCTFVGNAARYGGGIAMSGVSGSEIRRCVLRANVAEQGAAIFTDHAIALAEDCLLLYNDSHYSGDPLRGGQLSVVLAGYTSTVLTLRRCTIFGSKGAAVYAYSFGQAILDNCIVAGGNAAAAECFYGYLTFRCSDLWGNAQNWTGCIADQLGANGNFSADPLFCDVDADDFRIADLSPCAPEHSGGCGQIGAAGVGCGTVAVSGQSWGEVKAAYRGERTP